jgi:hypothetical protein
MNKYLTTSQRTVIIEKVFSIQSNNPGKQRATPTGKKDENSYEKWTIWLSIYQSPKQQ